MTVQEAKNQIEYNVKYRIFTPRVEALQIAIQCMEEVEQYRALGTVEELKEAREKQVAKNAEKIEPDANNDIDVWVDCPCCGATKRVSKHHNQYYCWKCGQLIELPYKKEGAENEK